MICIPTWITLFANFSSSHFSSGFFTFVKVDCIHNYFWSLYWVCCTTSNEDKTSSFDTNLKYKVNNCSICLCCCSVKTMKSHLQLLLILSYIYFTPTIGEAMSNIPFQVRKLTFTIFVFVLKQKSIQFNFFIKQITIICNAILISNVDTQLNCTVNIEKLLKHLFHQEESKIKLPSQTTGLEYGKNDTQENITDVPGTSPNTSEIDKVEKVQTVSILIHPPQKISSACSFW